MHDDAVTELLQVIFKIGRGEIPAFQHNECFTAGAFDLLLVDKRNGEAFDLMVKVCERYDEVSAEPDALPAYFDLLADLARVSQTTEVPDALVPIIKSHPDLSARLQEWYRLGT